MYTGPLPLHFLLCCPMDIVPARVSREVFDAVGPGLLVFIHTCLTSGIVPAAFKHAVTCSSSALSFFFVMNILYYYLNITNI